MGETLNLWEKLIEVRKLVTYLQKEKNSTQFKYVSNSQVLGAVREKMDELGIILKPEVTGHYVRESVIETPEKDRVEVILKRTTTYFTEVDMVYTWINAEKPTERESSTWYAQGVDIAGEKGVGKSYTYGEKYFLLKFFNIPTDLDDPDSFNNQPDITPPSVPVRKPEIPQVPQTETASSSPTPAKTISTGQIGLIRAKAIHGGYKDKTTELLMDISVMIGRSIIDLNEIKSSEVNPIIEWLNNQKKPLAE